MKGQKRIREAKKKEIPDNPEGTALELVKGGGQDLPERKLTSFSWPSQNWVGVKLLK